MPIENSPFTAAYQGTSAMPLALSIYLHPSATLAAKGRRFPNFPAPRPCSECPDTEISVASKSVFPPALIGLVASRNHVKIPAIAARRQQVGGTGCGGPAGQVGASGVELSDLPSVVSWPQGRAPLQRSMTAAGLGYGFRWSKSTPEHSRTINRCPRGTE